MVCPECQSKDKKFDERLGELVCQDCGLVLVVELFEQTASPYYADSVVRSADNGRVGTTTDGIPRHIRKGIHFCNMALNSIAPQLDLRDRVAKLYVECNNKAIFTSHSLEDRASAIVFYALKENNTPFTMKEVCGEYSSNPKLVKLLIRRINQAYGNKHCSCVNHDFSLSRECTKFKRGLQYENMCKKVLARLESDFDEQYFSRGKAYYAVICWYASLLMNEGLSQKEIAKQTGVSALTIKKKGTELCILLGFKNTDEMKGKQNEI